MLDVFLSEKCLNMSKELQIYIDGKYYPKSEAKISVYDHGLLYGDGVFEGIRAYNGIVFKLKEHIDRLYRSAHPIFLKMPLTKAELTEALLETLKITLREALTMAPVPSGLKQLAMSSAVAPWAP